MAIKTLRVFAEYTSTGFVPMPVAGGIDYGYTLANTFPSTQPSTFQTDDPDLDVTVTAMTDFYVWIRISGTAWNPSYTRNVRVYPDSPDINSVVMNMIIATGPAGVGAYTQIVQTANRLYFNGATTDSVYNSKFAGKTYINELNFGTAPQLATVATSGAYADLTGKPALATVATSGSYVDLSSKPSGTAPISYNSGTNSFQITQANSTTNGFLTSTDWNTFNNKYLLPSGGTTAQYLRGDGTLATFPTTIDSTRLILNGRNSTGTTLTKGTVVYINGVQGNTPLFARAIASADSTSAQTLGVVEFDIPNNSTGVVVLVGAVNNLDTSSYTEGVQLYLSGTVAGAFTSSKILAPTHLVYVGIVTRAHPTLGVVEVKIQNGYELDEIHDVQISSPADKHILYYDNATTLWKHSSVTSVLGYTPYNATNPSNYIALTALSASAPLSYNNTTGAFTIAQANGSTNGFLSSTDWTTFNSKQSALTLGNVSEVSSNVLMFPDGGTGKTIGNLSIQVVQAGASTNGYLSSTDWTTFNNKQSALTNPVTGTGTTNTLPKFTGTSALGNSNITDSGSLITLGSNTNISSGSLGIGTTSLIGTSLRISKTITGSVFAYGVLQNGAVQSDVTSTAWGFQNQLNTQATTFTVNNYRHYSTAQGTLGAGSVVSNQYGFYADNSLIGATNNFGFFGNIASGTGLWNLYMNGTASNYLAGSLGIGSTTLAQYSLRVSKTITGSTESIGIFQNGAVQSDVTGTAYGYSNQLNTQATAFALTNYRHYSAIQNIIGAGNTITNQIGFYADGGIIGATNNYGFQGAIAQGTNRWNLYMSGDANNYMAGSLGIGSTALTGNSLRISKSITGAINSIGIYQDGAIQSDVTNNANYFATYVSIQNTAFTLGNLTHYRAGAPATFTGATVTNQNGFFVESGLTGATNNYGFRGQIGSGTGRWNIFMDGTAQNYLAGNLGIGSGKTVPTYALDVAGDININSGQSYRIGGATYTVASTSTSGFLSSTDWNTFNNKASAFSGTTNYIPKFTSSSAIGNSIIQDNGTNVGIGTAASSWSLGRALELNNKGNGLWNASAADTRLMTNVYFNGGFFYGSNGVASIMETGDGFIWRTAPVGTANASATFTQRMTLTQGGNLGVGTASPFSDTNFTSTYIGGASGGQLILGNSTGGAGNRFLLLQGDSNGAQILAIGNKPIDFYTNGTLRATIASNGFITITSGIAVALTLNSSDANGAYMSFKRTGTDFGYVGSAYHLSIGGSANDMAIAGLTNITFASGSSLNIRGQITAGGNWLLGTTSDNGERLYVSGAIRATGNITANSDLTLKKNLKLIENPAEKLMSLNGYSYQWKENDEYQYGVIAQEVEKVMSYAVQTGNNGIKGVAYNQLTPLLIEGFKLHNSEITQLKERVKYLEAKLA